MGKIKSFIVWLIAPIVIAGGILLSVFKAGSKSKQKELETHDLKRANEIREQAKTATELPADFNEFNRDAHNENDDDEETRGY